MKIVWNLKASKSTKEAHLGQRNLDAAVEKFLFSPVAEKDINVIDFLWTHVKGGLPASKVLKIYLRYLLASDQALTSENLLDWIETSPKVEVRSKGDTYSLSEGGTSDDDEEFTEFLAFPVRSLTENGQHSDAWVDKGQAATLLQYVNQVARKRGDDSRSPNSSEALAQIFLTYVRQGRKLKLDKDTGEPQSFVLEDRMRLLMVDSGYSVAKTASSKA